MKEKMWSNEALEGKIEYIDMIMDYFNYAETHNVENVETFIKSMIEDDKKTYIELIDGNLNRMSTEK